MIYPPACVVCGGAVAPSAHLCAGCADAAPRLEAPVCAVCSWPFPVKVFGGAFPASLPALSLAMTCANCRDRAFAFGCAVSARRHDGPVRDLIVRFKYRGEQHLRRPLADWLAEALLDPRIANVPADALVPVPLHPRRRRERGYNQAEECCRLLGRRTGLPVWPILRRARYTGTQTLLSREERAKNLSGAFALAGGWPARWRRRQVEGADLLVVDDVFTSGATVDACARVLLAAGAASVRVLTVARR
ncbi:MAG: ComF family protein [Gluconacetobacter diazotrophicus]|nr:ComF family protein [Gluconacetobacter diazotrophicus]